jgi:hypothetical protein
MWIRTNSDNSVNFMVFNKYLMIRKIIAISDTYENVFKIIIIKFFSLNTMLQRLPQVIDISMSTLERLGVFFFQFFCDTTLVNY